MALGKKSGGLANMPDFLRKELDEIRKELQMQKDAISFLLSKDDEFNRQMESYHKQKLEKNEQTTR